MAKILVIDDSDFFRGVYVQSLEAKGFQVETAVNAKDGLEKMIASPPDLVFLDYVMPEMSGEEVLKQMQAYDTLKGIPVIMLTSISAEIIGADLMTVGPIAAYLKKEDASDDDVVNKAVEILGTSEKSYDPNNSSKDPQ